MKQKPTGWSRRYVTALRTYLKPGRRMVASDGLALRLGREAVGLGLETLDLTLLHERALISLALPKNKSGLIKRAAVFFAEANTQIEETHRVARQPKVRLSRWQEALERRTLELAATNRQLERGVERRKAREDEFAKTGKHYRRCLKESLQLQKRLRQLTHGVLAAQEADRKKISVELQDEIAQTLLGINVRLLLLKQHDGRNFKRLKNEIASAQRLVLESAKSVRRFARELDSPVADVKRSVRKFV